MTIANSKNNWKQNLVLIAKNTYVWLFQLSRKYERTITTLDQIPAQELNMLSDFGINGIWLVGIWERSRASKQIKSLYGFKEAAASAYSILSYDIAQSLGGRESFLKFREAAHAAGIKIGCDMVPNHTGLDSQWLIDHPDWYIEAKGNPSPDFKFTSPDLSPNENVQIQIEDGYYDQTGAAEVFSYRDIDTHAQRFFYHGNDGTSMPWNDTAQLNYLVQSVRQAVRATILQVAADFDIIRLDAAMTLTRQHFKRLWFPGDDGKRCIPTREPYNMSDEEFDRLMPDEFWTQVLADIQTHQPETLLLAEAFWLMEGYFIKNIGMHRVYNSAFMNMLKDEENAQFKRFLRDMPSIQPAALEHLVNYQTTPDEESAISLFGKNEKYFGVCTLLCTLPGLPMFGHGQLQGYWEKYGMDYLVPTMQESPDGELFSKQVARISPLLQHRELFSSSEFFRLHNFCDQNGDGIENVILFTNYSQGITTLVVFNNSPHHHRGTLQLSQIFDGNKIEGFTSFSQHPASNVILSMDPASDSLAFDLPPYASEAFRSV